MHVPESNPPPRRASGLGTGSVTAPGNDTETSPSKRRPTLDAPAPPGERCEAGPVNVDRDLLLFRADPGGSGPPPEDPRETVDPPCPRRGAAREGNRRCPSRPPASRTR